MGDEHNHFASMLNKRMERYCEEKRDTEEPMARFGAEAEKHRSQYAGGMREEAEKSASHALAELGGNMGRRRSAEERKVAAGVHSYEVYGATPASGLQPTPKSPQPPPRGTEQRKDLQPSDASTASSWSNMASRVPPLIPVNSSSHKPGERRLLDDNVGGGLQEEKKETLDSAVRRSSNESGQSSRITHVHQRLPGRGEGGGATLPSVRSAGGATSARTASQASSEGKTSTQAILRPQGSALGSNARAPESCLQALAAIDRTPRSR